MHSKSTAYSGNTNRGARRSPAQNEAKATCVYVIKVDNDRCKIGISSHPKRRLSGLQVSTPVQLSLFFQLRPANRSARDVEAAALALLLPWSARGEWVNCHPFVAQKVIESIDAGENIHPFLDLLPERERRWSLFKEAQDRNPSRYQDDGSKEAFAFYKQNEQACWDCRADIMRVIDPWGAAFYDPEDAKYKSREQKLTSKRRKKQSQPWATHPSQTLAAKMNYQIGRLERLRAAGG